MLAPEYSALIDDLSPRRTDEHPETVDATRWRLPGWSWLGCMVFGIAVWTGVGFGIRALVAAL
jgi:hypothetical protein